MIKSRWSVTVIAVGCFVTIMAGAGTVSAKRTDDVVVMKNGDRMTGEIKKLQRGELTFKADYMDESVVLDWTKVARLESQDPYLISFTTGYQIAEHFRLVDSGEDNFQIGPNGVLKIRQMDVLRILPIENRFWKQLEGSIGLGVNFTSGNDQ